MVMAMRRVPTCAVLNALSHLRPNLSVLIFTEVPEWFFHESLEVPFEFNSCKTDVGLFRNQYFHMTLKPL